MAGPGDVPSPEEPIWLDAQPFLDSVADHMAPGEMMHAPSFSLFEAMSAIEIGDPRMDASLAALTSPTAKDLVESGSVPTQLEAVTLLSVLDKQMIMEMTWQQGHSLAQTVFTCVYMLRPDRTFMLPLLAACCKSTYATCEQVKEFVMSAGICQDEDFQPFDYGLLLDKARQGQYATALAGLTAAEDQLKAASSSKSSKPQTSIPKATSHPPSASQTASASQSDSVPLPSSSQAQSSTPDEAAAPASSLPPLTSPDTSLRTEAPGSAADATSSAVIGAAHHTSSISDIGQRPGPSSLPGSDRQAHVLPAATAPDHAASDAGAKQEQAEAEQPWRRWHMDAASVQEGLLQRLRLRRSLMQALHHLWHPSANAVGTARRLLQIASQSLEMLQHHVPTARPDDFLVPGFHPDVNRRMLAPQPPRKVPVLGWKASCQELARMVADLQAACAVSAVTNLAQLRTFLLAYGKREAGALARSVLHWLLRTSAYGGDALKSIKPHAAKAGLGGKGLEPRASKSFPAWVPQSRMLAAAVGLPPEGPAISPEVDMFVEQAVIAVQGWCQGMCQNRARQRRRHRHALPDWAHLYQHSLNADLSPGFMDWQAAAGWHWPYPQADAPGEDHQGPLATWVERETALMMLQHLLLGFELELYQRNELCMIYWYCDYLLGVTLQACKKLAAGTHPSADGRSSMHSKPSNKTKRSEANDSRRLELILQSQELEVERELCQGMLRLCAGLSAAGALPPRPAPFNDEEHLFDQRFSCFNHCPRPEPLLHQQYAESVDPTGVSPAALFGMAKDNFLTAKRAANIIARMGTHSKEDLHALERVATQNTVALLLLSKVLFNGELEHVVSWDFSVHCCYPVLGLKKQ
ncbi:hypothetical protein WJX74_006074 [Apatococcus lobatus]|uniref:Uncharacterized protein n=1 Tax=Apatococcus lobatus TaxID=904363 RepID=A0AAW1S2K1_9CHLO